MIVATKTQAAIEKAAKEAKAAADKLKADKKASDATALVVVDKAATKKAESARECCDLRI